MDLPILGIDIGGSGIKGAPVDLSDGTFTDKRIRIDTPNPATPDNVMDVVAEIVERFDDQISHDSIGITIPAIVHHGITRSAANIDKSWIDFPADDAFTERLGRPVHLVNDADAAGVAEDRYGAARDASGLVILTTLGTGIGSALIYHGQLSPNSELGHLEIDGHDAESRASSKVKDVEGLSYEKWAKKRLQRYYEVVEFLFSPDLIVVGGGVSKDADQFLPFLELRTPIVPAKLLNTAGIVGAAYLAYTAEDDS